MLCLSHFPVAFCLSTFFFFRFWSWCSVMSLVAHTFKSGKFRLIALVAGAVVVLVLFYRRRYFGGTLAPNSRRRSSRNGTPTVTESETGGAASNRPRITSFSTSNRGSAKSHARRSSSGGSSKTTSPDPAPPHNDALPDLIVMMGIPGSGKSTWAKQYVFRCDASFSIVSSDEIRKQVTGKLNDQSRNDEVWEVVVNQVQGALRSGRNVILDATNTSSDKRRKFVAALPACNRFLKVMHIHKSIAKQRIAKDLSEGVERALVPDAIVETMYRRFNDSLQTIREEGWIMKT